MSKNVRWIFVPLKRLAEYLGGRRIEPGIRYVTGVPRFKTYPANGPHGIAASRRLRQIAAGSLRAENGLVS